VAGELIVESQIAFANSAPQNTAVDVDVPSQTESDGEHEYILTVRNPSAVTALTVHVKTQEKFDATFGGGADHYPELMTFAVPVSTPEGKEFTIEGWNLVGTKGRITITNDTVLGGAQGFAADMRLRKIG
jgi:hypothetical protein